MNLYCYNAGKVDDSKDEFVSLLPKLKMRVADTPGNIAEMLSKELARVSTFDIVPFKMFTFEKLFY